MPAAPPISTEDRVHYGTKTKLERYGWRIADKPGRFAMIEKRELRVDDRYQREVSGKDPKVGRISAEWSWIACGAILVAQRDGVFYVMDGQHRVIAARRRADIISLPCLVFETAGLKDEAKGFLAANTNRKPMTMVQRFKAMRETGDPIAVMAESLVKEAGRKIAKKSDQYSLTCVAELMRGLRDHESETRAVWPVLVQVCRGHRFNGHLLGAAIYLEVNAIGGASLAAKPWRERFVGAGYTALNDGMRAAAAYHKKGGEKVDAEGILKVINARIRSNPFALRGDAKAEG